MACRMRGCMTRRFMASRAPVSYFMRVARPGRADFIESALNPAETLNTAAEPTGTLAQALQHAARLLDREPLLAAEQAVEILKVFPAHPGATLLLGSARRAGGNPAAAVGGVEPPLAAHPTCAGAAFRLGRS